MIFPPRSSSPLHLQRTALRLRRLSAPPAEGVEPGNHSARRGEVAPIYPAQAARQRFFPPRSFAAQLLELGLRYNMPDLIRKSGEEENSHGFFANAALRIYAQAQDNFAADERIALFARFHA